MTCRHNQLFLHSFGSELRQLLLSHCDITNQAIGVPVGSSFGPDTSFTRAHPVTLPCHSGAQTGSAAGMTAQL